MSPLELVNKQPFSLDVSGPLIENSASSPSPIAIFVDAYKVYLLTAMGYTFKA